jgi:hypothetical protein
LRIEGESPQFGKDIQSALMAGYTCWRHRTLFFRDPEDNIIEIYAEY